MQRLHSGDKQTVDVVKEEVVIHTVERRRPGKRIRVYPIPALGRDVERGNRGNRNMSTSQIKSVQGIRRHVGRTPGSVCDARVSYREGGRMVEGVEL